MNFEDGAKLRRTSSTATAPDAPTALPRPKADPPRRKARKRHEAEQFEMPIVEGKR